MVHPILDRNILEIYNFIKDLFTKIVHNKEKTHKIVFDNVSTTKPTIVDEYMVIWEHVITYNITQYIEEELIISMNCYRADIDTYVLTISTSIFYKVIEISVDSVKKNHHKCQDLIYECIDNVIDAFIEEIKKLEAKINEAENEIVSKIKKLLMNKLGQLVDFSFPVFKTCEDVGTVKILKGYIEFYTTQYKVLVNFMYYIYDKKLIINSITIDAYRDNEDFLVSLLLPDIVKDLFDSS